MNLHYRFPRSLALIRSSGIVAASVRAAPVRLHFMQHWLAPGWQAAVVAGQAGGLAVLGDQLVEFAVGGLEGDV